MSEREPGRIRISAFVSCGMDTQCKRHREVRVRDEVRHVAGAERVDVDNEPRARDLLRQAGWLWFERTGWICPTCAEAHVRDGWRGESA